MKIVDDQLPKIAFSIKSKLAFLVISMSVLAFIVYVPVAYKHAQIVLGKQLMERAEFRLSQLQNTELDIANPEQFKIDTAPFVIGKRGYFMAADRAGNILTPHPQGFTQLKQDLHFDEHVQLLLSEKSSRLISHFEDTRYFVTADFGPYLLIAVASEKDFLPELYPILWKSLIMGLVFGTIFATLAYFFIKGITRPIQTVTKAAQHIARTHQAVKIKVATGDEIEILADQVTEMGRQIRTYEENLEQQIAKRTSELTDTNIELKEKTMILERVLEDVKKVDAELARLNRAKSEFISMASHQLRTPLTAIKWHSKIIENAGKRKFTPSQRRAFSQIVNANERMIELINALLNVSRIEMGALGIEPKTVLVNEEIMASLKVCKTVARERKVNLTHEKLPEVVAQLDPHLLGIILNNLLVNAIRYTPAGGKVAVALAKQGNYATISISDTGYGIPKAEQKQIFDKFFRASNAVERESTGTGLGLYLTKTLTEMLGGRIAFTSQEGKGSTFKVALPRSGLKKRVGTKGLIPLST